MISHAIYTVSTMSSFFRQDHDPMLLYNQVQYTLPKARIRTHSKGFSINQEKKKTKSSSTAIS